MTTQPDQRQLARYQNVTANGRAAVLGLGAIALYQGLPVVALVFAIVLLVAWLAEQANPTGEAICLIVAMGLTVSGIIRLVWSVW